MTRPESGALGRTQVRDTGARRPLWYSAAVGKGSCLRGHGGRLTIRSFDFQGVMAMRLFRRGDDKKERKPTEALPGLDDQAPAAAPDQSRLPDDDELEPGEVVRVVDGRIKVRVNSAAEAKQAIKELRLIKKDIQAKKKDAQAVIAEHRQAWRERQAGRIPTAGLPRGKFGRMARAGIQGKRRSERMEFDRELQQLEANRDIHDRDIVGVDGIIAQMERYALENADSPSNPATRENPALGSDHVRALRSLAEMRDADLITSDEYEAKKADILARM